VSGFLLFGLLKSISWSLQCSYFLHIVSVWQIIRLHVLTLPLSWLQIRDAKIRAFYDIFFINLLYLSFVLSSWESNSCGYRGDDGYLYLGHEKGESFGPRFTSGDIIGAGINYLSEDFFFT
jgi:hypothetical protein